MNSTEDFINNEKNKSFNEMKNENKYIEEILKEKKINKDIIKFSTSLNNCITEILFATKEYCSKINQIYEKIEIKNISKIIDKNPERKFVDIIYRILKDIIETITKNLVNLKNVSKNQEDIFINIDEDLKQKEEIFLLDIKKIEFTKLAYHQEFNNYELSLIQNELSNNNNNINMKYALDLQKSYLEMNEKLKSQVKNIFIIINKKRKLLFKGIFDNFKNFLGNVNFAIDNIYKKIEEEKCKELELKIFDDVNQIDEKINNIIIEDFYEFKFLSLYDREEKKESIYNCNELYDKLNEKNIENILEKLKKNNINFCQKNKEIINLIETKKDIELITNLILNSPEKFDSKKKEILLNKLKSSPKNQLIFLQYLNNTRSKGIFNLNKNTIIILCELFLDIINSSFQNNSYKNIQLCIILCQTYYHEEENKKIYMIHHMRKSKIFNEKNFWMNYFKGLINEEKKKIRLITDKKTLENKEAAIVYSSIFTLIKNMVDFDLDLDFITNLSDDIFTIYKISDNQKKDILNYLIVELQAPK